MILLKVKSPKLKYHLNLKKQKILPKHSILMMLKAGNGLSLFSKKLSEVMTVMPALNIFNRNILDYRPMKLRTS